MSNTSLLLICRSAEPQLTQVQQFLTNQNPHWQPYFSLNNPDLHVINAEGEGVQISDVRELISELSLRPFQEKQSLFVILAADSASIPAQQALLKSLEEPPAHVQIVLAATQIAKLLPTIQSRCVIAKWPLQEITVARDQTQASEFWQQLSHRSFGDLVTESEKYKERDQALAFCQELLFFLHSQNTQSPSLGLVEAIKTCQQTQQYLEQNVNVRLALENCFFQLKRIASSG
jgi:hypothetical protein